MKNFTVVICTFKRQFLIHKCLESVLSNSVLPEKIIIVDQNYDDLTYTKVINLFRNKSFKNYVIIRNLIQKGLTKSKNISLKNVNTKYIFFIDDDICIEKNYFYKILKLIIKKKAIGVCGVVSNYSNNYFKNILYFFFNFNIFKDNRYFFINYLKLRARKYYHKVFQLPGGITCFDKKIFKKISFDEKYVTHNYEDVEFNLRIRKNFSNPNLYIHLNAMVIDRLEKNFKENLFKRIYFMRLLYLRNKTLKIKIYFYLSFVGLFISNLFNLNLNDYIKIIKNLYYANKKI